jgi:predicted negative regulator of RcsB-dependent stress response
MTDSAYAEFKRLCDKRELAAYRLVGAVDCVLRFFEAEDFDQAEAALRRAKAEYEDADLKITHFLNSKKENSNHAA